MTNRLAVLADSYLDHIRIAVEANDRGAPFRDFFDNWNAFRLEHDWHRSRGERPRWFNNPNAVRRSGMLERLDFHSQGASAIVAYARSAPLEYQRRYSMRDKSTKLIVDHSVPVAVMANMLFQPDVDLSRDGVRNHLIRWYRLGLLSDKENVCLDMAGLKSTMPPGWDEKDVFFRYRYAGLKPAKLFAD